MMTMVMMSRFAWRRWLRSYVTARQRQAAPSTWPLLWTWTVHHNASTGSGASGIALVLMVLLLLVGYLFLILVLVLIDVSAMVNVNGSDVTSDTITLTITDNVNTVEDIDVQVSVYRLHWLVTLSTRATRSRGQWLHLGNNTDVPTLCVTSLFCLFFYLRHFSEHLLYAAH